MKCKKCGKEFEPGKGLINYCSLQCRNSRVFSEESKKKTSLKMKGYHYGAAISKGGESLIIKVCPICNKEFKISSYYKKRIYCSKNCYNKDSEGKFRIFAGGGYHKNSTIKHRSTYNGFQMDSGAERIFAILLDENNVKWIKNTTQFFEYINKKGKRSKYYPDFYLPELNQWIEIKGKFYADKDENLQLKLNSVSNIKIIYSKELSLCKRNIKKLITFEV